MGTATASVGFNGGTPANYTVSSATGTFTIGPASSSMALTCPASADFDGAPLTPCSATVTGVGGLNQSVVVQYTNNTNVGTNTAQATATYTPAAGANWTTSTKSANFSILPAPITATAGGYTGVYDANTHTPAACVVTATPPGTYTGTATCVDTPNSVGAPVGSGTISPTTSVGNGDSINNYTVTPVTAPWSISVAQSSVVVTCPSSVTYTGSALTPTCTAVVSGVGTGITQTVTWSYTNNTNAGTATATATYAGDSNHAGSSGSGNFTISPATSSVTVSCAPGSFPYTGAPVTPACTATVTGVGTGVAQGVTWTYTNNVNVGTNTATATANYPGDSNHSASSGSANFSITQGIPTLLLTCTEVTYDGNPHTCTGSATPSRPPAPGPTVRGLKRPRAATRRREPLPAPTTTFRAARQRLRSSSTPHRQR